jgi:diaminopimelate epimerase
MFKNFIKYHSLGNDLIILDGYKEPYNRVQHAIHDHSLSHFIASLCDRHYGVGADGVLIISDNRTFCMPEMNIFNLDGSRAENCLNGLRCVAHYVYSTHVPKRHFLIKVGNRIMSCEIQPSLIDPMCHTIITKVGMVTCSGTKTLSVQAGTFFGHVVSIGNSHFIVFGHTTLEWLSAHGKSLESHDLFPEKTNVEFVEKVSGEESTYTMLVYERACGITLACGTGAAALTGLLAAQSQIVPYQKNIVKMPGGSLCTWVDSDGDIMLQASAHLVFKGTF